MMYYLSVTAIFKMENPWLEEWINYHHARGVEHFYLYNNDENPGKAEKILLPYVKKGLVQTFPVMGRLPQFQAYCHVFSEFGKKSRWMAVIDLDEFLLPRHCADIRTVLEDYESAIALTVHWNIFGSNGLKKRPSNQIDYFLRKAPDNFDKNRFVKSIVFPQNVDWNDIYYPHVFHYHSGHAVNENHIRTDHSMSNFTGSRIRINHYCVRAREDFLEVKSVRGVATPSDKRNELFWRVFDRNEVYDDEISRRFGETPPNTHPLTYRRFR